MDLLHKNPMLQGVRQMMHAYAKSMIRPIATKHDQEESMPWELMRAAANMGMSQTALLDTNKGPLAQAAASDGDESKPKTTGRMQIIATEELAWGCAGITLALGGSGLACTPIARIGTDEQKKVFRDAMEGLDEEGHVRVAAMALSEPSTGSDISGLSTTARKDGEYYILNGHKQWITNGRSASAYVIWAQTDAKLGRGGVRAFLVTRATEGLVPGRKEVKLGIRASETAQVHLEDCRVHESMILGHDKPSQGLGDTKTMLDSTRPLVGIQAVGIARAAYDFLVDRIRGWELHNTPMAGHQHIAFELAEMEMEIEASRLLCHRAAWMADHRLENVKMASMAKAHSARTAEWVTHRAMAMLGEEALQAGHPVEKWYRDAKIFDIFEGTGQIQRRIIAKHTTGLNAT